MRDLDKEYQEALDREDLPVILDILGEMERVERERAKKEITEALLMLGIMPRSLVRERYAN